MEFKVFKNAVEAQYQRMKDHPLFRVSVDRDKLWETYLASFPEGTNPIFRERTEHDCSCCRQFVKQAGGMVAIIDGKLVSIWDVEVGGFYDRVADAMAALVRSAPIENIFLHTERSIGADHNFEDRDGVPHRWNHFYAQLPPGLVLRGEQIGVKLSEARSTFDVFKRGLSEITPGAIDTVLELIDQNSIYRGAEHKHAVVAFRDLARAESESEYPDLFCWAQSVAHNPAVTRIRNTSIGTLLLDISNGVELDAAVKAFEVKVAPSNYKRPTALITPSMIKQAEAKVEELGLTSALDRRFAVPEDLTINNVLFADRTSRKVMHGGGAFDTLRAEAQSVDPKSFSRLDEVHISHFLTQVLPHASTMELLLENRHNGNLFSLIAPRHRDSGRLFKWPNNFSWSYNGEVADSMKERVKAAGGNVTGDLRFSLQWNEELEDQHIDLDAHCEEPGEHIYFANMRNLRSGGNLDVDNRHPGGKIAVENIVYPQRSRMPNGSYRFRVHNYSGARCAKGFRAEIEFDGQVFQFSYNRAIPGRTFVDVATVTKRPDNSFNIDAHLENQQQSQDIWGLKTQQFHRVAMVMNSPNYWDDLKVGNQHLFFVLEGCKNPDHARGFYNEFLDSRLDPHRKVFEVLAGKTKVPPPSEQLSGLGFSVTQRSSVICRVTGSFARTLKITF